MRTIVEIPEELVRALDRLKEREKSSRSKLIRDAVESFLRSRKAGGLKSLPGFGCWGGEGPDGVSHQRRLRSEWRR